MADVVSTARDGTVAIVTIDNPPVNALSFAVVSGLADAFTECADDDGVEAVVLTGAGRMFVAGADISEFSVPRPADVPGLDAVIKLIETLDKPVVAAINGIAFGGGLELAMGCHYRLAGPKVSVGQPEVKLGLIPGAGGTQRLPRLTGVGPALDMIVGGDPVSADKALELGIVDEVVDGDLVARAVAFAAEKAAAGEAPRQTGALADKIAGVDAKTFDDYRASIAKRARGLNAPFVGIDCVRAATEKPLEDGLAFERDEFEKLRASDQSRAMRYMFFAEREVTKIPDIPRDTPAAEIKKAAVIGSGTMGGGIAMNFANAGIPVTVIDVSDEALDAGLEKVRANYAGSVSRGRLSQAAMDERMALIGRGRDYAAIADADIVIEAVFEDMDLKKKIFAALDAACKPAAILASNTSSLDINEIATATKRPDKVVGTHFFSPANVMKLLENVRTEKASKESVATVMALAKTLGKVGVLVGVGDGFVGNRMLHLAARVSEFLLEEGATPAQVDKAIYDFGFPMGPFAVSDLAGVDIRGATRAVQKTLYPGRREPVMLDKVLALGRLGQKTGAGWYKYEGGSRTPIPDPEIDKLIDETIDELGTAKRAFTDAEIVERYIAALISQGARVLEEGLAQRASDIDVIWHYGYGFPRHRGGPMFYADLIGLDKVLATMEELHAAYGEWCEPAPLLGKLVKDGKTFADL
jgi:3-hydroxyacyl-CoA dehydrogenase